MNILLKKIGLLNVIIFLMLPASQAFSQSGSRWSRINIRPENNNLNAVEMLPSGHGFVVGDYGFVSRTSDSGASWLVSVLATNGVLRGVCMESDLVAIIVGDSGQIYRTTDDGVQWLKIQTNFIDTLRSVSSPTASVFFAVGSGGTMLLSTDDGITWETQKSPTTRSLYDVQFNSSGTGVAVGERGIILRSSDHGSSWTLNSSGVTSLLRHITRAGDSIWWASGDQWSILKSSNGIHWDTVQIEPDALMDPYATTTAIFFDSRNGVVLAKELSYPLYEAYFTSDGGTSWSQQHNFDPALVVNSASHSAFPVALAVGDHGKIFHVKAGLNWKLLKQASTVKYSCISFSDPLYGFAAGLLNDPYAPALQASKTLVDRSTDGGFTWSSIYNKNPDYNLLDIAAPTRKLIIAVGDHGAILRSSDGGSDWNLIPSGIDSKIPCISMANNQFGAAVSLPRTIIRTTDGGLTWTSISLNDSLPKNLIASVACPSPDRIVVAAVDGTALYSTNRGESWLRFSFPKATSKIAFLDSLHGWAVGGERTGVGDAERDVIMKTNDGGLDWSVNIDSEIIPSSGLNNISFGDPLHGFAVGNAARLLHTTNGGQNWIQDPILINAAYNFYGVSAIGRNDAITVSTGGDIFRFQGKESDGVSAEQGGTLDHVDIYPNPSASSVNISFYNSHAGKIQLDIYNSLGLRVLRTKTQEFSEGRHEAMVPVTHLSGGIYFVKILTNAKVFVKSFVVSK